MDELAQGLTDNVKTVYPDPSSQTQFARGGGGRFNWILTRESFGSNELVQESILYTQFKSRKKDHAS